MSDSVLGCLAVYGYALGCALIAGTMKAACAGGAERRWWARMVLASLLTGGVGVFGWGLWWLARAALPEFKPNPPKLPEARVVER